MPVSDKIRNKFKDLCRRRRYDPNYEPDSIADKAINVDVRQSLVIEGRELGMGPSEMSKILGVSPALISRDIEKIDVRRFRSLPAGWLQSKFVARLDGLERYENYAWGEVGKTDDPDEKAMWLGRAIQANYKAGELIAQVASKGRDQNPLLPVVDERMGQPTDRESLFQQVYEATLMAKANGKDESIEEADISEGNGKA